MPCCSRPPPERRPPERPQQPHIDGSVLVEAAQALVVEAEQELAVEATQARVVEVAQALVGAETAGDVEAILALAPAGVCEQPLPEMGMVQVGVTRTAGDRVVLRHGLAEAKGTIDTDPSLALAMVQVGQLEGDPSDIFACLSEETTLFAGEVAVVGDLGWIPAFITPSLIEEELDDLELEMWRERQIPEAPVPVSVKPEPEPEHSLEVGVTPAHKASAEDEAQESREGRVEDINSVMYTDLSLVREIDYKELGHGFKAADLATAAGGGQLLLHIVAASQCCRADVLGALIDANPAAASVADNNGRMPLHWAAATRQTVEVVQLLLAGDAGAAASVKDGDGALPLQLAMQSGCGVEILTLLQSTTPKAVELDVAAVSDWLVTSAKTASDVEAILGMVPDGVCAQSLPEMGLVHVSVGRKKGDRVVLRRGLGEKKGEFALHAEAEEADSLCAGEVAIVTEADEYNSHSDRQNIRLVRESDHKELGHEFKAADLATAAGGGQLLLHIAAASQCCRADVLGALIDANPAAASVADNNGRMPLHWAAATRQTVEVVQLLLAAHAAAVGVADNNNQLPHKIAYKARCSADVTALLHTKAARWRGSFLGRYLLMRQLIVHRSATCMVLFADDLTSGKPVALKLMRHKHQFDAELMGRKVNGIVIDATIVVAVLGWHILAGTSVTDDIGETLEREEQDLNDHTDLAMYTHVLSMERGERSLHDACAKERIAGIRIKDIKDLMRSIALRLQQLHGYRVCHGDLKQRNIIRIGKEQILCDMDASNRFGLPIGDKTSTAYCPPELARIRFTADRGTTLAAAEPSFDIWSFGVVGFELCSGNTLFSQDIANDELVNDDDKTRLCTWLVMSDTELEPVLNSSEVEFEDATRAQRCQIVSDAKSLIRWCLQGHPSLRPTIEQILSHRFLNPDAGEPAPQPMRYHTFISHAQADASGIASTLFFAYSRLGMHCWLDMRQALLTLAGMRQGVRDSDLFLLVLSANVLQSWFCQQELLCALAEQKPIQLVKEVDPRFSPFDDAAWTAFNDAVDSNDAAVLETSREQVDGQTVETIICRVAGSPFDKLPLTIRDAINRALPSVVTYRRRDFEQEAMMAELCARNGVVLPSMSPDDVARRQTVSSHRLISIFVICNQVTAGAMLVDLMEALKASDDVKLLSDVAELEVADKVLLLLSKDVLASPALELLEEALRIDREQSCDRICTVFNEDAGWHFGCDEQKSASAAVQNCLTEHEALAYRPKDPTGTLPDRHEFPAMVQKLMRNLGVAV